MIDVSVNPNTVHISMISKRCLKAEFDSTYPIHLNGIISQEEFRQSINRINHVISLKEMFILLILFVGLTTIGGIILYAIVWKTSLYFRTFDFSRLSFLGFIWITFTAMVFVIPCCMLQSRQITKIRRAIAEESKKYSSLSPIPCSWRLESTTYYTEESGNRYYSRIDYYLVIDIDRSTDLENATYHCYPSASEASTSV